MVVTMTVRTEGTGDYLLKPQMNTLCESNKLNIPPSSNVDGFRVNLVSCVILGDKIFSLKL